jgi:hypothetical protein
MEPAYVRRPAKITRRRHASVAAARESTKALGPGDPRRNRGQGCPGSSLTRAFVPLPEALELVHVQAAVAIAVRLVET